MLPASNGVSFQLLAQVALVPPVQTHGMDAAVEEIVRIHSGMTVSEGPLWSFGDYSAAIVITVELSLSELTLATSPLAIIPAGYVCVLSFPGIGEVHFRYWPKRKCCVILGNTIEVSTQTTSGSIITAGDSHCDYPGRIIGHTEAKICP